MNGKKVAVVERRKGRRNNMELETIVEVEEIPFTFIEYTDEDPYRASMQDMLDDNEDYREEEEFNRRGRWN
jgi:hypothetical protein